MFDVITHIEIQQRATQDFPNRNLTVTLDFCTEFSCSETWSTLTNMGSLKFPKNIYVRDAQGRRYPLAGSNKNVGGFSTTPLFLRGDKITIRAGYRWLNKIGGIEEEVQERFTGFIAKVGSKMPVELHLEDNMWLLKQIAVENKVWPAAEYTLEKMLTEMLQGSGLTVNTLTNTTLKTDVGNFTTANDTVATVLDRLRKDYHFESYFRGNELRCGSVVYVEAEAKTHVFRFQHNIIADELEYQRRDDVLLGATAYSVDEKELDSTTKDGQKKTKKERLEVFVGKKGGEVRTLYFWNVKTVEALKELAELELQKFYYTGFRGKFTTFGLPHVRQGDNVRIEDPILPERNGTYKVKGVETTGGMGGLRQVITLDYKTL